MLSVVEVWPQEFGNGDTPSFILVLLHNCDDHARDRTSRPVDRVDIVHFACLGVFGQADVESAGLVVGAVGGARNLNQRENKA